MTIARRKLAWEIFLKAIVLWALLKRSHKWLHYIFIGRRPKVSGISSRFSGKAACIMLDFLLKKVSISSFGARGHLHTSKNLLLERRKRTLRELTELFYNGNENFGLASKK